MKLPVVKRSFFLLFFCFFPLFRSPVAPRGKYFYSLLVKRSKIKWTCAFGLVLYKYARIDKSFIQSASTGNSHLSLNNTTTSTELTQFFTFSPLRPPLVFIFSAMFSLFRMVLTGRICETTRSSLN